jgi:polyisoprenoid-binding protein YceI
MTTTATPQSTLTDLTGTYTLDPAHTRIGFVARHAMVTKVRGAFNEFEGTGTLDGTSPANSRVQVTIDAASIDTRNAQRDEHLRGNDFLAMKEYPRITFSSTGVRQLDATTFEVTGDLTIKGGFGWCCCSPL